VEAVESLKFDVEDVLWGIAHHLALDEAMQGLESCGVATLWGGARDSAAKKGVQEKLTEGVVEGLAGFEAGNLVCMVEFGVMAVL
jgi:hypothetical protein